MVAWKRVEGIDDHITVGLDAGDFSQAHRKVNGHEEWRVTPELMEAEIDSLVANYVRPIKSDALNQPGTYVVSLKRMQIMFAIPKKLGPLGLRLFWRLIATKRVTRTSGGRKFEVIIEERKLKHLVNEAKGPLSILGRLFRHVPPKVPLSVMRRLAKWTVVRPQTVANRNQEVFFVVSRDYFGFLWGSESGGVQYLSVAPILQMWERMERNLPFGKLRGVADDWTGDLRISGQTW